MLFLPSSLPILDLSMPQHLLAVLITAACVRDADIAVVAVSSQLAAL